MSKWTAERVSPGSDFFDLYDDHGFCVAETIEGEHRACLFAASPDMLEAFRLIEARSNVLKTDDEAELRRQMLHINTLARVAIAKAEGQP